MGHQIRFYLDETDTHELVTRVSGIEQMTILLERSRGPFPNTVESVDVVENGRRQLFYYFALTSDLDIIVTQEVISQGYWSVDSLFSPVIQFTACENSESSIRQGRLYYTTAYYDQNDNLVKKPKCFREWSKKVFDKARESLKYDKSLQAFIGHGAKRLRDEGFKFIEF